MQRIFLAMKKMAKRALQPAIDFGKDYIRQMIPGAIREACEVHQEMQRIIVNQYKMFKMQGITPYETIKEAGFRVYSQFEEDGIILYILSMIGFKTRRVVEMCCGSAHECMATNLILNHGFNGYLFDGGRENIALAKRFFSSKKDCLLSAPVLRQGWITAENVNDLLTENRCTGEVDLLSLDMDGNDYWVWRVIEAINPRLLVCEINSNIPSDKALAIEYRADFDSRYPKNGLENYYRNASLLAWQRLCKRRGYRMIGAHRHGFNVFFLREDEGARFFPEMRIDEVHDINIIQYQTHIWGLVRDMRWKEVDGG
jgi:hypothetical protein